jgi:predicted Zn-dependent protease
VLGLNQAARAQIFNDVQAELRVNWLMMKREMPRHPNPAVQRFAECIARAIVKVVPDEWQNLDWEIIVFDSESTNASVTPEGKIAVFSGLLQVASTPDRLAAVLGHEVAHLTEGHVRERVLRAAGTGLLGALGSAVTGFGNESQQAAQVVFQLPYQRNQENEADIAGMKLAAQAGYNPAAALEIWRQRVAESGRRSEFLSTHPDPELRMREMAANISPALKIYNDALDSGIRPLCNL